MNDFTTLANRLNRSLDHLSPSEREHVEKILITLIELSDLIASKPHHEHVTLPSISKYITKKLKEEHQFEEREFQKGFSLQQFRNELMHGASFKKYDPSKIKAFETIIWRTLEQSASEWNGQELSNLLSYCLNTNTIDIATKNIELRMIVRIYRAIYNAYGEDRKQETLRELIYRLFSEPRFREAFERASLK